jgi:hypothetical protein
VIDFSPDFKVEDERHFFDESRLFAVENDFGRNATRPRDLTFRGIPAL